MSRIEEVRDEAVVFFGGSGLCMHASMHACIHGDTYARMFRRIDESGGEAAEIPAVWGSSSRRASGRQCSLGFWVSS